MAIILSFPDILVSQEPRPLDAAVELRTVRAQAAVVRSLLDELDLLTTMEGGSPVSAEVAAQTVEEMTTLAWRIQHAAAALAPHRVSRGTPAAEPAGEDEPQRIAG